MEEFVQYMEADTIEYSSNETIENVHFHDSTVELICFVEKMSSPENVGRDGNYRVMKVIIANGQGHRIQVKIWNEQIERIQPFILPNHIIHLDAASARSITSSNFNQGTVPYELAIQSNTKINCLGKHNIAQAAPKVPVLLTLDNLMDKAEELIRIEGYVKTVFKSFKDKYDRTSFYCGSITDGFYKLEVRIYNFDLKETDDFEKGEKVEVTGVMNFENPIYIKVKSPSDIRKLKGAKMSLADLLNGNNKIKKRTFETNTTDRESKKLKIE